MKSYVVIFGLLVIGGMAPAAIAASSSTPVSMETRVNTEAVVRDYFADLPVMVEIARCESKFRQFNDSGTVLRGGVDGQMVGVFQFFNRYHETAANRLGFDITTLDGNMAYAKYLYDTEGTAPWSASQPCWRAAQVADDTLSNDVLKQKIALLEQIITLLERLIEEQEKFA